MILEMMKYLGIGYRELLDAPRWIFEIASVRMREEGEYNAYLNSKHKT